MYEIALCDDDNTFSDAFGRMLSDALDAKDVSYRLTSFSDIISLQNALENGITYHLIFLDIIFQKEDGLFFANFLRKQKWKTDLIFVTSSSDYAVAGYDAAPLHYLLKPVSSDKLEQALERFLDKNNPLSICFTTPKGILHIRLSDILYFEIYDHNIIIHKTDRKKETCIGTLKDIEISLPPMTFVRPHRSYLVNLDYISEIVRYRMRLSSGETIPISKNLYNQIQDKFIDYAGQKSIPI